MSRLTVVTWNVNSIRLRIEQVAQVAADSGADVLCLQETKVKDAAFPAQACRAMGFPHVAFAGMPAYNGVAVLSRVPLHAPRVHAWCGREDARHLEVRLGTPQGPRLHCLYVPAGGDEPDPEANPRFRYKLDFLDALTAWLADSGDAPALLTGDLNVAPLPADVWDHKRLQRVVTHTPVEVARLEALQASRGWVDAMRHFVPGTEPLFTWWSYRARDWRSANRGRRLDHLWVTPDLVPGLAGMAVLTAARDWTRPSDHAPVAVTLDLPMREPDGSPLPR